MSGQCDEDQEEGQDGTASVAVADHTEGVTRWRRPYRPVDGLWTALGALAFGGPPFVFFTVGLLLAEGPWRGFYLVPLAAIVVLVRGVTVGLLVSDRGVRIRNFWLTRTVAWADIALVASRPTGLPSQDTIWLVVRRHGRLVWYRTQVRRAGARLLGWGFRDRRGGFADRSVPPDVYLSVLRLLRERVEAATTGEAPTKA